MWVRQAQKIYHHIDWLLSLNRNVQLESICDLCKKPINKLNKIKYQLKIGQIFAFSGCDVVYFVNTKNDGVVNKKALQQKTIYHTTKNNHLCLHILFPTPPTGCNIRSMIARLPPDRLSFGSRSLLVHFSLGPRSSLVRLSFVIRQSIEDRTRTERGISEKRTKEQRTSNEIIARNYRRLDGKLSNLMGRAVCNSDDS